MNSELVPHVDKDDNFLGLVERAEAYKKGLIHRGAHGIIRNEKNLYLIQQRSRSKSSWPGHYDLSLAETVKPDETYEDALKRGLKEELDIEDVPISVIKAKYYQEYFWEAYKVFGVVYLYEILSNKEPRFADGEVMNSQWLTENEVFVLITDFSKCTPWFVNDWKFYIQTK